MLYDADEWTYSRCEMRSATGDFGSIQETGGAIFPGFTDITMSGQHPMDQMVEVSKRRHLRTRQIFTPR
jgi:hypothetical protein